MKKIISLLTIVGLLFAYAQEENDCDNHSGGSDNMSSNLATSVIVGTDYVSDIIIEYVF